MGILLGAIQADPSAVAALAGGDVLARHAGVKPNEGVQAHAGLLRGLGMTVDVDGDVPRHPGGVEHIESTVAHDIAGLIQALIAARHLKDIVFVAPHFIKPGVYDWA